MAGVLEGLSAEKTISAFYIAYFGRAADPQGFAYWLGDFARGQSLTQIANNFAPQGETAEEYPFLVNDTDGDGTFEVAPVSDTAFFRAGLRDVISDIYVNLFGREPTADELAEGGGVDYWVDEILVRGQPLGEIAIRIANGASPADAAVLVNKIDVAESFTLAASEAGIGDQASEVTPEFKAASAAIVASVDETEESVTAAEEAIADFVAGGGSGGTFTLTDDAGENIGGTAANETFNAILGGPDATLQTFDSINGGGGNDTLNLVVEANVALPGSTSISAVETVNLEQSAFVVADLSAEDFAGATAIWQIGGATDIADVGTTTTAGFRDVEADATVTFSGATGAIALDEAADGSDLIIDGEDVTSVTISGTVADNAGAAGAVSVALGADAESVTTLTASFTSDTVVVLDPTLLDLEGFSTFNASASTGDIEVDFDNATTGDYLTDISLGSGNDTVYYDLFEANNEEGGAEVTIDLGAGDDDLTVNAQGNLENNSLEITLGAGSDDVVEDGSFDNIVDSTEANFEAGLVSITDFNVAEDTLDVSLIGLTEVTLTNTQLADIADEDNLFDALGVAGGYVGAGGIAAFNFGENTYIYGDTSGDAAFSDGDGLIELVGVTVQELNGTNFVA